MVGWTTRKIVIVLKVLRDRGRVYYVFETVSKSPRAAKVVMRIQS
jgi:hypothetical protein